MQSRGATIGFGIVLAISMSGCAAAGHTSSPWEFGGGVRVAPGWPVGDANLTAHPMASYTYLSFDGGHDSLWEVGAQIRKHPTSDDGRAFWIGGEAALSYLNTVVDAFDSFGESYSDGTAGFSITALAGVPVSESRWGVNLYGGAGVSHYGSVGLNVRVGVDLQPWFLSR